MNIFRRLKNLWRLSGISEYYPVPSDMKPLQIQVNNATNLFQESQTKMAQIIKMNPIDPIDEVIQHE